MNTIFKLILSRFATGSPPSTPRSRVVAGLPLLLLGLVLAGAGALQGQGTMETFYDLLANSWDDANWQTAGDSGPTDAYTNGVYIFHDWELRIVTVSSDTEMQIEIENHHPSSGHLEYVDIDTTWGPNEVFIIDPNNGARLLVIFGTDAGEDLSWTVQAHHVIVFGMAGDDDIYPTASGNAQWHLVFGGTGDDYIDANGAEGTHFYYGDWLGPLYMSADTPEGEDDIIGGPNNDWIVGGSLDDIIYGMDGNDEIYGGDGDDVIYGGSALGSGDGYDRLYGESGADTLIGGEEDTYFSGGVGSDNIWCGDGYSTAFGGDGDDLIVGGPDGGSYDGDAGNDVIIATSGWCFLFAGTGDDLLVAGDSNSATYSDLYGEFGTNYFITSDQEDNEFLFLGHSTSAAYIWRDNGDVVDNSNNATVHYDPANGSLPNWHDSNPWVMATQFWTTIHSGRN